MKKPIPVILPILISLAACIGLSACSAAPADEPAPASAAVAAEAQAPTPTPTPTATPDPTPTPAPKNRSQTSGRVIPEGTPSRPVIVSIENSEGARPQTGLIEADIIYEFIVESAITRFQALYNDTYPIYAGPLRSARYYFIDLAQEWDCMYLHIGYGPPKGSKFYLAPSKIAERLALYPRPSDKSFNGYASAFSRNRGPYTDYSLRGYRFRSSDRSAPHNLYIMVDKMVEDYYGDHEAALHERFRFSENAQLNEGEPFSTVSLTYQSTYDPEWIQFTYDETDHRLYRWQDGARFMVRTPSADGDSYDLEQMSVQNLIVQYVTYGRMPKDDKGRRTCDVLGGGKCEYFINGRHLTGTWSRPTVDDATIYLLDDGSTVTLEPGNTWIAMHPADIPVTFS